MGKNALDRHLAAILTADLVGYSRLTGQDETGTVRRFKALLKNTIEPAIARHRGRIVKTMGDGLLAEFPSAVEAVSCAITIQKRNAPDASTSEDKRLVLRIGINLGDIILEDDDIFGDGVNVAARLEGLSEPGGLCVSRAIRDQVRDKLPLHFDDIGEQVVKNIVRPIRAFRIGPEAVATAPDLLPSEYQGARARRVTWLVMGAVVLAGLAAPIVWWTESKQWTLSRAASTSVAPSGATLAVLPLTTLGDNNDDYFSDALTDDLISALGRFRDLSVISRAATMAYKGKTVPLEEVGRNLRARYILDGNVRRTPELIRVSVHLTDTARGILLWSHRIDAEPRDVFTVQDEIARQISGALALRVTDLELARLATKPPSDLQAYDLVLRGRDLLSRETRSSNAQARGLFERAIQLDPNYAPAFVGLGRVDLASATQGWTPTPFDTLRRAETRARRAVELDDLSPGAHSLMGRIALYLGDHDRALAELRRATDLNGSDAEALAGLIGVLLWAGDFQGAIAAGETLIKFQTSFMPVEAFHLGTAYILANRPYDAIRLLENAVDRNRANMYTYVGLAMAYAQVGRQADAERQVAIIHERYPTFARDDFGSLLRDSAARERLSNTLRSAGL
jgi:class 3 adenylate cyclase/TolB-like protein